MAEARFGLGFSESPSTRKPKAKTVACEPATLRVTADGFFGFGEDAVAKCDRFSRCGRNALARNYDADEIQRVGCGESHNFAGGGLASAGAQ